VGVLQRLGRLWTTMTKGSAAVPRQLEAPR
jgi:hypothetical protein